MVLGCVPAVSAEEQVTLRMAWWGSQNRHDKTVAAIELYESLNPNINIEYEFYSFDDYFTKLKTLVASDEVWDIFQLGGNFPMYLDKIYPLDEFIESGVVDVSKISAANLQTTQQTDGTQ
ncbi:MAG: extracellular solute-binding protein, partial [Blautia sp.]|nr:extracellular solute-binding protein [Blautia sp.]